MNEVGSKSISIAALIVHALTILLFIFRDVFEFNANLSFQLMWVVLLAVGLLLTSILAYRFARSVWHTHCLIREFFQRKRPYASERMLLLFEREPYKLLHSRICITYEDPDGKRVSVRKYQEIEVIAEQIDHIWDRGIVADPTAKGASVVDFRTSMGTLAPAVTDGTGHSVRNELPRPYKKGERFSRELRYTLLNSYCAEHENFVLTAGKIADRITVEITVPEPAHLYNATVEYAVAVLRIPLQNKLPVEKSEDSRTLTWSVDEPTFGEKFILHWTVGKGSATSDEDERAGDELESNTSNRLKKSRKSVNLKKPSEESEPRQSSTSRARQPGYPRKSQSSD